MILNKTGEILFSFDSLTIKYFNHNQDYHRRINIRTKTNAIVKVFIFFYLWTKNFYSEWNENQITQVLVEVKLLRMAYRLPNSPISDLKERTAPFGHWLGSSVRPRSISLFGIKIMADPSHEPLLKASDTTAFSYYDPNTAIIGRFKYFKKQGTLKKIPIVLASVLATRRSNIKFSAISWIQIWPFLEPCACFMFLAFQP